MTVMNIWKHYRDKLTSSYCASICTLLSIRDVVRYNHTIKWDPCKTARLNKKCTFHSMYILTLNKQYTSSKAVAKREAIAPLSPARPKLNFTSKTSNFRRLLVQNVKSSRASGANTLKCLMYLKSVQKWVCFLSISVKMSGKFLI